MSSSHIWVHLQLHYFYTATISFKCKKDAFFPVFLSLFLLQDALNSEGNYLRFLKLVLRFIEMALLRRPLTVLYL